MKKKCKYCFSALSEQDSICKVCKIDSVKNKKEITKEEKKVAYRCRAIYIVAFLAIIGGILGILSSLALIPVLINKFTVDMLIFFFLHFVPAVAFLYFGFSARKYKRWCYVGGIILYSFAIIMGLLTRQLFMVIFGILFLSYIASPTSKRIFYRKV